jgi:hypothetical protein
LKVALNTINQPTNHICMITPVSQRLNISCIN